MKEIRKERTVTNRSVDSLERYLQELGTYPLLTAEEEAVLAKKIRAGDRAALQKLITSNLRFVVTVAKKYEMPGISLADLVAEGNIGLMKAAERFDETKGFKFISYAVWWIRQSILYSINVNKRMIRLPHNRIKGIADIVQAEEALEQDLQRSPSVNELSEFTGLSYRCVMEYASNTGYVSSFDAAIGDEHCEGRWSIMIDREAILPDAVFEREALAIDFEMMLNAVTNREREVIRLAYGIYDGCALENSDVGKTLGVSSETVRRVKLKALSKLSANRTIGMMRKYM